MTTSVKWFSVNFDGLTYSHDGGRMCCIRPTIAKGEFPRSVVYFIGRLFVVEQLKQNRCEESIDDQQNILCIPSSVAIVCESCFIGCEALSLVAFEFNSKLSRIENLAFGNRWSMPEDAFVPIMQACSSLSSICIPSSVEVLRQSSFSGCIALSVLTFESGSQLSLIEKCAFEGCSSLSSICIPSSVEIIGEDCFSGCKALRTVRFEADSKLARIEDYAFEYCSSLSSIYIPPGLVHLGCLAFFDTPFCDISIDAANLEFSLLDCFLVNHDGRTIVLGGWNASELTIPASIEELGCGCFAGRQMLSIVRFENDSRVSRIEKFAFQYCSSLSSICIPYSVTIICECSFYGCGNLSIVSFESDCRLTRIEQSAFWECSSLRSICIPASVEAIDCHCFSMCGALSVVSFESGSHLARIDKAAFEHCSSLSSIWVPCALRPVLHEYEEILKVYP
jgi:hypothetical protein